ncbi:MAG: UbiX family flavin prenyltransferase [Thermodesulfobacteriota bacterium]
MLLGITGASGAAYGLRCAGLLLAGGIELHVLVTRMGWDILQEETGAGKVPGTTAGRKRWLAGRIGDSRPFRLHAEDDFRIPFASGSNPPDAMIVAPCSMGTVGRIASGVSSSVLTRCADVALKERRPLVLVIRETPLSVLHLENMLSLARAGADILPACPAFYHRPASVGDMVDFVASRALSRIGIDAGVLPRWGEDAVKGGAQ